jgi:hypothetical protein
VLSIRSSVTIGGLRCCSDGVEGDLIVVMEVSQVVEVEVIDEELGDRREFS